MTLFSLILTLVVVGVILWLINTYIPMEGNIKKIMNIGTAVVVVLWLLSATGVFQHAETIRIGTL